MTPAQIIQDFVAAGGRIAFRPPDTLSVDCPPAAKPLVPLLKEHKPAIIAALREPPADPCPACAGRYWWRLREGDGWACGHCRPDPRGARWRGVTAATLGDRRIMLHAAAADLPKCGEWVRLPGGAIGDLLAYTTDRIEALVRLLIRGVPEGEPPRFAWVAADRIAGELEWSRRARA
ncbi:MAG: hypothetical protein ACRD2F_00130 [Terriglobales bacterium]